MRPRFIDAIEALAPGVGYGTFEEKITDWRSTEIAQPTGEAIQEKLAELRADYDSKQYQRDRKYPSIGEQLDQIYWDKNNGTKNWEETIDAVKAEHPRP